MRYRNVALLSLWTLFAAPVFGASDADKATSTAAPAQSGPASSGPQAVQPKASGTSTSSASKDAQTTKQNPAKPVKKVDLNNASLQELMTLPTVGETEAKKIIAHRPYKSKGELVTKAGLPEGVYQAVRYRVEMQAPRKTAPKK